MRIEVNEKSSFIYHLYDSPTELVDRIKSHRRDGEYFFSSHHASFCGRRFSSWEDARRKFREPWKEGLQTVERLSEEIKHSVPAPKSRRRKPRWNEDDGDVCVDRLIAADVDYFRLTKREIHHGTSNIALLCHVGGNCFITNTELFWRGATLTALVDLLEDAGYNVEAWCYEITNGAWWTGACRHLFQGIKIKEAGNPLHIDTIANVTSAWFFRTYFFADMEMGEGPNETRQVDSAFGRCDYTMTKDHREKLDVTQNILEFHLDPKALSKDQAIASAREILKKIENQ